MRVTKMKNMIKKECISNCIFAVDGVCRLEHTHGIKQPECPYREGEQASVSTL